MKKLSFALVVLSLTLSPLTGVEAVPVACDCATCLLSPDRLCTEPSPQVKVWRCRDYTAERCPVSTSVTTGLDEIQGKRF